MSEAPPRTSLLLDAVGRGDSDAVGELMPAVYTELRDVAGRLMRAERSDHTLQPTALVNEAFVKLAQGEPQRWESEVQFKRLAAKAMRNILVDHARARGADKRGGARGKVSLDAGVDALARDSAGTLELHDALERLAVMDPQLGQIVEMRFFGGCDRREVAAALGVSVKTVERGWRLAYAWLANELEA
jgi:RNA polymerase sigma-70 factor (ECF subfamily)